MLINTNINHSIKIQEKESIFPAAQKQADSSLLSRYGRMAIGVSILLGCSLMTTGRKIDILDGISLAAGGAALTTLCSGVYHTIKKHSNKGIKLLTASFVLAALAGVSRGISANLEPSFLPSSDNFPPFLKNQEKEKPKISDAIYEKWFNGNKAIIDQLKKMDPPGPALGAMQGMAVLEPHALVRAGWYQLVRYAGNPGNYGFDKLDTVNCSQSPALLLPGAIGNWHYLGDLAQALKQSGVPVFVIDVGPGGPTDNKLHMVREKIADIGSLYANCTNPPKVDLVAHSMGANLGIAAAYDQSSVFINSDGDLNFPCQTSPQGNSLVGKVIMLANPLIKQDIEPLKQAQKIDMFSTILAKYDGIMGHKESGLVGQYAHQNEDVPTGHIGIAFDTETFQRVINKVKI